MSICALATHDTHCHLLLGLKSLDLSKEASQTEASAALVAIASGASLPTLLSSDKMLAEEIERRVASFLCSGVECFDFYSTCYKDAKLSYEVLSSYRDSFAQAGKRAHLGIGLHPYWLTDDYAIELEVLCALIEHIVTASPELVVSLGEIGLDKRLDVSMDTQCSFVQDFILRTLHYNLPYSCHCVRAYNELDRLLLSISKSKPQHCSPKLSSPITHQNTQLKPQLQAIIHGFNGSVGTAIALLNKGYKLGVGKAILSERNHKKFAEIIHAAREAVKPLVQSSAAGGPSKGDYESCRGKVLSVSNGLLLLESDYDGSSSSEYDCHLLRLIYETYKSY